MGWYEPGLPRPEHASALACTWTARPVGRHRLVPDACMDLVCTWRHRSRVGGTPEVWICGPERSAWTFELPAGSVAVGVRFRPGYASITFDIDASSMLDRRVRFSDVVGSDEASRLTEALLLADGLDASARALERSIAEHLVAIDANDRRFVDCMTDLLVRSPRVAQSTLADDAGLTPRQLHRRLLRSFGHGASMLGRQLRFQRFLAVHEASTHHSAPTWGTSVAALAAAAGYADQAHLSRDCRALTGLTVRAFLTEWFPTFPDMSDPFKTSVPLVATMAR